MSNDAMWQHPMPQKKQEVDWQQYRIQAAIAIVQGWASTPQGLTKVCMAGAVELADALVAELQKKGGEQ